MTRGILFKSVLLVSLVMGCMISCNLNNPAKSATEQQSSEQKLADLNRQKDDVLYEIQIRQDEINEMETSAKKPGVIGVSHEWLVRRDQLREEIINLKVKAHDLDQRIAAAPRTQ